MTECRPIRRDEGDDFLRLVCRVFELDFERARSVFYVEPLYSFNENWGLFESGELVSCLSKVTLEFGWGRAYGIASVATGPENRGRGLAGRLLDAVHQSELATGSSAGYLFAQDTGLYDRLGFRVVDSVVEGELACEVAPDSMPSILRSEDVQRRYNQWAEASSNRLRRGANRWSVWQWPVRLCLAEGEGYTCIESQHIREWVSPDGRFPQILWEPATFRGLESMVDRYRVPLQGVQRPLVLMARGRSEPVEFFLTDQF